MAMGVQLGTLLGVYAECLRIVRSYRQPFRKRLSKLIYCAPEASCVRLAVRPSVAAGLYRNAAFDLAEVQGPLGAGIAAAEE